MDTGLAQTIAEQKAGKPFRSISIELDNETAAGFIRLRFNPSSFTKKIFKGDWGDSNSKPATGQIRLLSAINDESGALRIIGRQGSELYVFTVS